VTPARGKETETPMKAAPTLVSLDPDSIEALAMRVAELVGTRTEESPRQSPPPATDSPNGITAEEVARTWGVTRRWVYKRAAELGAWPIGRGERPRLRFDPAKVSVALGPPPELEPDTNGCEPIASDCPPDSLSPPARASVADVPRRRAGGNAARRRTGAARAARIEKDRPRRSV
jgi:hypothetical protein